MIARARADCHMALLEWTPGDGIANAISCEFEALGCRVTLFGPGDPIPADATLLFTFGPYGRLLPILRQLEGFPLERRPKSIHWNTEGVPDIRWPWLWVRAIGVWRSAIERAMVAAPLPRPLRPLHLIERWLARYRYVGDLYYAQQRGWLQVIADTSTIYAQLRSENGLPTLYVPWGATREWYADLGLARDIDVLWMGKRASPRRGDLLDHVRDALRARGYNLYIADNVERPFIFDDKRTTILNRAKITLNLTRTWYDDNFSRFLLAAPNRSLIVSERVLPHCPEFKAGEHYVSASPETLVDTLLYYLEHASERQRIVDNAYELATTSLTMRNSMTILLTAARAARHAPMAIGGVPRPA